VREAVRDPAPEVRQVAVCALAERPNDAAAAMTLGRALECEEDEEVLLALVAALGRVGTVDAVQRLIAVAEPGGRIFNKKSTALRVASVHALGEARTAAATATLTALAADREREVRDAATRVLGRA
jgi:HEAT repeat protein